MSIAQKIINHLKNQEVTEPELRSIYTNFGKDVYREGFDDGSEYIRGMISRQKAARRSNLVKKCNKFLIKLDDYLSPVE